MSADEISRLLYDRSGLLGVSGISGDMQRLLDLDDPHAAEAVDLFVYRAPVARSARWPPRWVDWTHWCSPLG